RDQVNVQRQPTRPTKQSCNSRIRVWNSAKELAFREHLPHREPSQRYCDAAETGFRGQRRSRHSTLRRHKNLCYKGRATKITRATCQRLRSAPPSSSRAVSITVAKEDTDHGSDPTQHSRNGRRSCGDCRSASSICPAR